MTEHFPADREWASVAIIGGGLSGAAVAYHLAHQVPSEAVRITVIEPRGELGQGVAYGTIDPAHRLNVPHATMTLTTAEPDHFARWLRETTTAAPDWLTPDGRIFPPRAVFGRYVADQIQPLIETGRIRHLGLRAVDVFPDQGGYGIILENGDRLFADVVVLAVSHPPPGLPTELGALAGHPVLIADPFARGALNEIQPDERVLIVGSGLTGADMVASLSQRLDPGHVHLLSRHGWRSQPHGPDQNETTADFATAPARTTLALLRRIRAALARDAAEGLTWHASFDRLRGQANAIWAALPVHERRRLLRHLRGLWDIHRFRIAPQTHEALLSAEASGRLTAHTGRITALRLRGASVQLDIRRRGSDSIATIDVDRVILATGPAHGRITETHQLLRRMAERRMLRADDLKLGLKVSSVGEVIDGAGAVLPNLLVAGPLARASVGELMGVPEITAWAEHIARAAAGLSMRSRVGD
ncbi:FAD-dependent oxidoreductase [Paracoccus caeni]|uniref:FAD-dependent oxidoreductase n=1 Tax=Paracoccus caeni TaxID=657651 RepID=A0A934SHE2_9RHOB|nr:FAD-dependent oxidoreductase [Paracoccus caeni]MBK4217494.1 FAD-dependent oxidoreductase [Paracoccus caeni]